MNHIALKASLLGTAIALAATPSFAQTKTTNQGISATEIVVGTHQDLSDRKSVV